LQGKGFRINGVSSLTLNGAADCWVTLYDADNFQGEQHTYYKRDFVVGECKYVWSDRTDSIKVSRGARGPLPPCNRNKKCIVINDGGEVSETVLTLTKSP